MNKTLRLLQNQTFYSSLGDYTQWVHLACHHWFGLHSTRSAQTEWKSETVKTFFIKTSTESHIRWWPWGLHLVGALCVPPLTQNYNRHKLVDSTEKVTRHKFKHPVGVQMECGITRRCTKKSLQIAYPNRTSNKIRVQSEAILPGHWLEGPHLRHKQHDCFHAPPSPAP